MTCTLKKSPFTKGYKTLPVPFILVFGPHMINALIILQKGCVKEYLMVSTMTKVLLATLLSTAVLIQCQDSELATCTYCHHVLYFTVTLVQTSPSYSKVCPHDNVIINCTTYNSDDLIWYNPAPGLSAVTYSLYSTNLPYSLGVFNITDATKSDKMRSSVVTLYNITIDQNNTYIECWNSFGNHRMIVNKTTIISGIANNATNTLMMFLDSPSPPINLSINYDPVNQTLSWLPPTDDSSNCMIVHYTVYDNNTNITTTSSLNTSLTLSKGTVHNFTVTSTDTVDRVGRHSHELTIIWDGK